MYKQNELCENLESALSKTEFMFAYSVDVSKDGKSAVIAAGTEEPDFPEIYIIRDNEAYKVEDNSVLIDSAIKRAAWAENETDILIFDDYSIGLLICDSDTKEVIRYESLESSSPYIKQKMEEIKSFI